MSVQTKELLIRSARGVFAEKGYYNAHISHIIEKAGVARGTFYLYFEGKDEIFREVLKRAIDDLREIIKPVDISRDIQDQVHSNVCGVVYYALKNKDLTKIVLYRDRWNENSRIIDEFIKDLIQIIERSLEKGISMGILRVHNTHILALVIVGAIKEVIKEIIEKENVDVSNLCKDLVEFWLRGLMKEGKP